MIIDYYERTIKTENQRVCPQLYQSNRSVSNTYVANHIKKQLIRCSTSVAANYRATCIAQSKPSFIAKISIVIEEVDESNFWLEFSLDEKIIKESSVEEILRESKELTSIFIASRKTASKK